MAATAQQSPSWPALHRHLQVAAGRELEPAAQPTHRHFVAGQLAAFTGLGTLRAEGVGTLSAGMPAMEERLL